LSAHYDIAHGAGLAIVIPPYMKHICQVHPSKYRQYGVNVLGIDPAGRSDFEVGMEAVAKTKELFRRMGAPVSLGEVGIGPEKLEMMAGQMVKDGPLGSYASIAKGEMLKILQEAL